MTSSRAHSAKVARTTLECVSSPTALPHTDRASTLSPQLSPQPLHHHTCVQALKHGCAVRGLRSLRHGGSLTSWNCDPSQQFSLDVASWNAVCRGAWLRAGTAVATTWGQPISGRCLTSRAATNVVPRSCRALCLSHSDASAELPLTLVTLTMQKVLYCPA